MPGAKICWITWWFYFLKSSIFFSVVVAQFTFPPTVYECSFPHVSLTSVICVLYDMAIPTVGRPKFSILILTCFFSSNYGVEHAISFFKSLVQYNIKIFSFSSTLSSSLDSGIWGVEWGMIGFLLHFYSFLNLPLCVSRLLQEAVLRAERENRGLRRVVIQPSALHRVRVPVVSGWGSPAA